VTYSENARRCDAVAFREFGRGDLAEIRRMTETVALEAGLSRDAAGHVTAATSEIAANAVEHGERPHSVSIDCDDHRLRVNVSDGGSGFDIGAAHMERPAPSSDRGRGLWLSAQWVDSIEVVREPGRFTVRLIVRLPG